MDQLRKYIDMKEESGSTSGGAVRVPADVAPYIDHTLLKPEATKEQINRLCDEAAKHNFYSVCVNSSWVSICARKLQDTEVKVCSVVGFPLGAMQSRSKGLEARCAIEDGAQEIDMVINVGFLKSGDLKKVEEDSYGQSNSALYRPKLHALAVQIQYIFSGYRNGISLYWPFHCGESTFNHTFKAIFLNTKVFERYIKFYLFHGYSGETCHPFWLKVYH